MLLPFPIVVAFCFIMSSCWSGSDEGQRPVVDSFATAYYNWRFFDAVSYVAPESKPHLSYLASQVNQEDVDSLRAMDEGATVEIDDMDDVDDSTALARVTVRHFLAMDTIGRPPHIVDESTFSIKVVKKGEKWMVKKLPPLGA